MKRLAYIDALRGLAIVFMAINHASHYLTPELTPAWAYLAIYLTVTLAAPLFLFVVGMSLALSQANNPAGAVFQKYLKRGLILIGLGLLINLFFYFDEPLWRGRILQTIGISVILAYSFFNLIADRIRRLILLAVSIAGLLIFPLIFPLLQIFSSSHRIFAEILLSEFPIYPWFFVVLIGLIAGKEFLAQDGLSRKIRKKILAGGAILIFCWPILSLLSHGVNIFSFANDYNLNGYWNPSPITWLWISGWIMILVLIFYGRENYVLRSMLRNKLRSNCLAIMGENALVLYFLQFFLIITVGHNALGLEISGLFWFTAINIFIIYLLCLSAKCKASAIAMVYGRPRPKARIS